METKTIIVKSVEKTSGTKKDGSAWRRTSIKATDGKFYSSFTALPEAALTPGSELKLQVEQSKITNTYDIKKLIEYAPSNTAQSGPEAGTGHLPNFVPPGPKLPPLPEPLSDKQIDAFIAEAKHRVAEEYGESPSSIANDDPLFLRVLDAKVKGFEQAYNLALNRRIEAIDMLKLKVYGKM
jgi:hypothetical protein